MSERHTTASEPSAPERRLYVVTERCGCSLCFHATADSVVAPRVIAALRGLWFTVLEYPADAEPDVRRCAEHAAP